jgi:hypothetical protein
MAFGFTPGFQPEMVPSSVTNKKIAFTFGATGNAAVGLKTTPAGASVPLPSGVRIFTTRDCGTPLALYKVERPLPLSETHQGLTLARASPQALTRLESGLMGVVDGEAEVTLAVRSVYDDTAAQWQNPATATPMSWQPEHFYERRRLTYLHVVWTNLLQDVALISNNALILGSWSNLKVGRSGICHKIIWSL